MKHTGLSELYIHIPFCVEKCGYCDFLSFPAGEDRRARYLAALQEEICCMGGMLQDAGRQMTSVFIGGGTPSVLSAEQIRSLMELVRAHFSVAADAEITIEVNPGTADADKFQALRAAGINRVSIGCQSMHDRELARMGRIHDRAAFLRAFADARDAGFCNINIDLMSGLPGQSLSSWRETLRLASELNPEHISAYSLILEEGTPFYEQRANLELPDEETERVMYEETAELLEPYGYRQYEISNYAKPGYECRHNIGYWAGVPYLGVGLGAASFWPESGEMEKESEDHSGKTGKESEDHSGKTGKESADHSGKIEKGSADRTGAMLRFRNPSDADTYIELCGRHADAEAVEKHPLHIIEERLDKKDQESEWMILGLRMTQGVSPEQFRERFLETPEEVFGEVISRYRREGLLEIAGGRIRLTKRGRSLANVVMAAFL